jgi:hypothetical protein
MLVLPLVATDAVAQAGAERGGFSFREISLSTGFGSVQLPPVTLGGFLPLDVLHEDFLATGAADVTWYRVRPRTRIGLELFGAYTARSKYSQLNSPAADVRFGASHVFGNRWQLHAWAGNAITSSDQLAVQPSDARRLVDRAGSFGDLAPAARSLHPDPEQAALFVPIRQSLVGADLYGMRIMASSASAEATYVRSPRTTTYLRGSYASIRRISSAQDPKDVLTFPDSSAGGAGLGVRYRRTERTQVVAAVDWTQTSGISEDQLLMTTVGYTWSGRRWFTVTTAGVAVRPFAVAVAEGVQPPSRTPALIWNAGVGYSVGTQTMLVQYNVEPHDMYGYGGQNAKTGFQGNVQSVAALWSWSVPRSRWVTRADFSMIRRPGNFSYIYAWLATAGVERQITPHVRLIGDVVFDRHGSRGFEGYHLSRESARLTLAWTPRRRAVE